MEKIKNSKTLLAITGIAVVFIITGLAFSSFQKKEDIEPITEINEPVTKEETAQDLTSSPDVVTLEGNLFNLDIGDQGYRCDVKSELVADSTGVAFIKGDNIKSEFKVNAPIVGALDIFMIADQESVYVWNSMMPGSGFKAQRTDIANTQNQNQTQLGFFDPNAEYSYNCVKEDIGDDIFTLPSGIAFTDI